MPLVPSQAFNRVINPVFEWFETRDEVFPDQLPSRPPADFWGFIEHYAWPFRYMIAAVAVSGGVTALFEILVYSYLGTLVDWLAKADRNTFWSDHGWQMAGMAFIVTGLLALGFVGLRGIGTGT